MSEPRPIPPEAQVALQKAKFALMAKPSTTFFSSLLCSVAHKMDWEVPEEATNGTRIKYNPERFLGLNVEERVGTLLQQTMHIALMHMTRMAGRDRKKWELACDYVVNNMLIEKGFTLPKDSMIDPQYSGMSAEQVYNSLTEQEKNKMPDSKMGLEEPGSGEGEDKQDGKGKGNSPMTQEQKANAEENLRQKIEDMVVQAATQSAMRGEDPGNIPGEFQLFLDKLLNPKLPWQVILRRFMQSTSKNDYSYRKPNRRFFPKYHLPSMYSEGMVNPMVGVDISGSVSDEDFKQFLSETNQIMKALKPKQIDFIQFDTSIHHHDKIKNLNDLMKLEFHGRGGTDVTCLIEEAMKLRPKVLLVFTDGYFGWDGVPKYDGPTIWVIHNNKNFTAPYGQVVHYEL